MATLHTEFSAQTIDETKISAVDRKINSYIEKYSGKRYFDDVLAAESDWQVFYQLSDLRTGLISWYDFKSDARILEVGAGFGALTGKLCEKGRFVTATERSLYRAQALAKRYKTLENLEIYAGDLYEIDFREKYDYILVVGLLERMANRQVSYLRHLQELLAPEGRLLLAVENRFGLRYFCGARDFYTKRAFGGITQYNRNTESSHTLSRQELASMIKEAGYAQQRFYYPLPDYKLPQLIYTEEYLPEQNLKERLIPYYPKADTLVANELNLYDDIVANEVFPFFANSFFVECGKNLSETSQVLYAALSTDRGRERSYATVIQSVLQRGTKNRQKQVVKTPLYEEGIPNANQLFDNICDLQKHGVPVVPHSRQQDGSLLQPFIQWPTLSNYLKNIVQDEEHFLRLLDKIYTYILQSSEQVSEKQNALWEKWKSEAESENKKEPDFGPILAKAYIELIPLNCFVNPETEEFLYFDQEFVRENYPAKYILFRAIHYIYVFTSGAEQYCPKQKVIERYQLADSWEIYLKEEKRFLEEVRNHKKYAQFYKWTKTDWKRMQMNARRLESEEEKIADYQISDTMKKIWKVELQMLDEVDRICKKYSFTYYLVHGTLLGAVRHKGFIPWDDDLDIAMPRESYDSFLKVAKQELSEPLSIHTPETEQEIFWGGFARIRNSQTTAIESRDINQNGNKGIWIDILPLDICTTDDKKLEKKEKEIRHLQRLIYAKRYGSKNHRFLDMNPWQWKWYQIRASFYRSEKLCQRLDRAMRLYTTQEKDKSELATFTGYGKFRRLSARDFEQITYLEFAGSRYPAPAGYENYLCAIMGRDYMKYPPEEERKPKHKGIFDPAQPYAVYEEKLSNLFRDCSGKEVILFGAGLMFEDYMKKYGGKYRPAFLVDNDESKWGKYRLGIEIRQPEAILKVPEKKRVVIICSYYYNEIEKQLKDMHIADYRIYVQNIEWIIQKQREGES